MRMTPPRIPLESSTPASVLYLPTHRQLELEFRSGQIYRYLDVPPQAYRDLLAAPSKGICFNSNIRSTFTFLQLSFCGIGHECPRHTSDGSREGGFPAGFGGLLERIRHFDQRG